MGVWWSSVLATLWVAMPLPLAKISLVSGKLVIMACIYLTYFIFSLPVRPFCLATYRESEDDELRLFNCPMVVEWRTPDCLSLGSGGRVEDPRRPLAWQWWQSGGPENSPRWAVLTEWRTPGRPSLGRVDPRMPFTGPSGPQDILHWAEWTPEHTPFTWPLAG